MAQQFDIPYISDGWLKCLGQFDIPYISDGWFMFAFPVADVDWSIREETAYREIGIVALRSALYNSARKKKDYDFLSH